MTSFLNFHAFAAALRPELRALFERGTATPRSEVTVRNDGMVQSGPDPIFAEVAPERGNMSLVPQPSGPPDTRGEPSNIGSASSKTHEMTRIVRLAGLLKACACVGCSSLCRGSVT
jgi:hypothetical protein